MQDTIIKVGVTRQDDYGNLWVTPTDGGQEVKIGEKRSALFPLFQQGNTVSLHWETFKNKPYIKDAKQIAGEPAQPAKIPTQPRQEAFKADPEKIASMERQKAMEIDSKFRDTALMQACAVAKERTTEGILHCADLFYAWLEGEKAPEKPEHKEVVKPAQQEAPLSATEGNSPIVAEIQRLLDTLMWKPATWRSWIKMQRWDGVDTTGTLAEVLSKCNPNQINIFANHLKELTESMAYRDHTNPY